MGRDKSTILEHPITSTETKEKKMPKMTLAEAKGDLKDCKAAVRETKRDATDCQKAFIADPNKESAKDYRSAVADHIYAINAQVKSEARVEKLTPAD